MTALQALRIGLAGGAFVGFGIGGALLSWLVLPLASLDPDRTRRQRRCQRLVQATFVLFHDYMRWCGLVAYDPRRVPKDLPEGAFMLVTNHPTLIDVSALVAAYGELCVVAKSSLFRNPLLGPLLRLCGHIESKKLAFGEPGEVVAQAVERLRRGQRVLIFPEGSRSPQHGLRRFHQGAFSAAVEAGVPVVLGVIRAEPPGLMKGQAWHAIPKRAIVWTLTSLGAIEPSEKPNAKELLALARRRIEEELKALHDGCEPASHHVPNADSGAS
jgi:1-acyl-sn-glycerol-3-phosphate acyltransferase